MHIIIIFLVLARNDIIHPLLMFKILLDCLFNTFFELNAQHPTEFYLKFARVNCVTGIVIKAIDNVGEVHILPLLRVQGDGQRIWTDEAYTACDNDIIDDLQY